MSYTKADHERIVTALHQVNAAVDAAVAAVAAGQVDAAMQGIERASSARSAATTSFPGIVVNESASLRFEDVYPDFYDIDVLIIIGLQWPDTAPSSITEMKEVIDGFTEKLANLRQLRAQPWAPREDQALIGLDQLIAKSEQLQEALEQLPPGGRLDPRKFDWLGHAIKAQFLNGVGEAELVGEMYSLLFSLNHALDRSRWSVEHHKLPGASRRLVEAQRVTGLLINWLRDHQPAGNED